LGIENVYQIDMLLSAPECDPTPCRCWGRVSLKIEELIVKLKRESTHKFKGKSDVAV